MRKIFFHFVAGALAMLLFIAGAFFPAKINSFLNSQKMPLAVESITQLGNVPKGKTTTREILLFNPHFSTVALRSVGTSCGCTAARTSGENIAPFQSGTVTVSVNPVQAGTGSQSVELNTNLGTQQIWINYNAL